jgi:NNP family nitrate/nitrite transporter-like MFS transporter
VFAALSFVVIAPVLFLAFATSYPALLLGGLVLGPGRGLVRGRVPFVSAWFPPERRGFALGVYGMGNIGSAISGFLTPRIASSVGRPWAFLIVAVALAASGSPSWWPGRDAPNRPRATQPFMSRFLAASRLPIARDLAVLYAITFGGFVAFGVYLPTFLKTVYGLGTTDAASRAAGFVVLATLARPVGGWLSDRVSGIKVLQWALGWSQLALCVTAFQPPHRAGHDRLPAMAAALGLGNGAVFALVGTGVPAASVGSVTGLVGAAGGLGGFLPPIVMGLVYQATGDYAIGLMLLSDVALAGLVFTAWRLGTAPPNRPDRLSRTNMAARPGRRHRPAASQTTRAPGTAQARSTAGDDEGGARPRRLTPASFNDRTPAMSPCPRGALARDLPETAPH